MALIEFDNYKTQLMSYKTPLEEIRASLDLENKQQRIAEMERQMEEPTFWDDPDKSAKIMKDLNSLKSSVSRYNSLKSQFEDIETLIEMGREEDDAELAQEAGEALAAFTKDIENMRTSLLLSGEYDANNAIVALSASTGGTEAMDFNEMLYRMYTRWCEKHGFTVKLLDYQEGDEAGIKGVTFSVEGENAYGLLKSEAGVHRLVRISPFNAQGKRQTSFCSCDVMPELDDNIEIEIDPSDLKIDTYRSSGAGGQHVNKTESAIRITHLPTGVVVECQDERSQYKNKDRAMQILRSKLYEMEQARQNAAVAAERKSQIGSGDRSERIRTYNFPQNRVTDHRLGGDTKNFNIDRIINGDLDELIDALVTADQAAKLAENSEFGVRNSES